MHLTRSETDTQLTPNENEVFLTLGKWTVNAIYWTELCQSIASLPTVMNIHDP